MVNKVLSLTPAIILYSFLSQHPVLKGADIRIAVDVFLQFLMKQVDRLLLPKRRISVSDFITDTGRRRSLQAVIGQIGVMADLMNDRHGRDCPAFGLIQESLEGRAGIDRDCRIMLRL